MALYNGDDNYIFFHIFRTGGMSLRQVFQPTGPEILGSHVFARDLKQHFVSNGAGWVWEEATKFTVIRNPYDWMVSVYFYIRQQTKHPFHEYMQTKTFAEFLVWYEKKVKEPRIFGKNPYSTLTKFCCDENGNQLMDVLLRFEGFPGCVHRLRKKLGLPPIKIPHKNTTKRQKDYRSYHTPQTKILIKRIFAEDLERFDYEF